MLYVICNGCFTQVSELWPVGLLLKCSMFIINIPNTAEMYLDTICHVIWMFPHLQITHHTSISCDPVIWKQPLNVILWVIAQVLVNIVPSWDMEGHEHASVRRYPIEGQYSAISV